MAKQFVFISLQKCLRMRKAYGGTVRYGLPFSFEFEGSTALLRDQAFFRCLGTDGFRMFRETGAGDGRRGIVKSRGRGNSSPNHPNRNAFGFAKPHAKPHALLEKHADPNAEPERDSDMDYLRDRDADLSSDFDADFPSHADGSGPHPHRDSDGDAEGDRLVHAYRDGNLYLYP